MAINRDDINKILDNLTFSEVRALAVDALFGFQTRIRALEEKPPFSEEEEDDLRAQYESAVVESTFTSVRSLAFDELFRMSENMPEGVFRTQFALDG